MTRSINVYTLTNIDDLGRAMIELQETGRLLPDGSCLQVFLNSDKELPKVMPGTFFGDIVQVIDFPQPWQAAQWEDSSAYIDQKSRCAGLFSSATNLSYPL